MSDDAIPKIWCAGDDCLNFWPEGPLPEGWTVSNVEGRLEPCCPDCTKFYSEQIS